MSPTAAHSAPSRTLLAVLALVLAAPALLIGVLATPAAADEVDLTAFRNSNGISTHPLAASNFDGGGYSYSRVALLLEGIDSGTEVEADGLTYTWPDAQPGQPDNVEMDGQVIPVLPGDATRIGFLGASHNGPITADITLHYSRIVDGVTEDVAVVVPLRFSDWTLNANNSQPEPGNEIAITTRFRVNGTTVEQVPTHVFAASIPIDPTMTLQSIELDDEDKMHLFGLALG